MLNQNIPSAFIAILTIRSHFIQTINVQLKNSIRRMILPFRMLQQRQNAGIITLSIIQYTICR